MVKLFKNHRDLNVNGANPSWGGWTPLLVAAENNHVEVTKLLLSHPQMEVNGQNDRGATAVFIACSVGALAAVKVLLKDARVDVTLPDNDGWSPPSSCLHAQSP